MNLATCPGPARYRAAALLILVLAAFFCFAGGAFAGGASAGDSVFYPCTSCHPVVDGQASKKLPNGFKGHSIELEVHDALGKGSSACVVCHEDPAKDPGKLKLIDGSLVDMSSDEGVAKVCYRCHSEKYKEWSAGTHGKPTGKCTSAGCHNPHAPSWIYVSPLLPFVGTGFQTHAVGSERQPFTPLASAPVPAPVETPWWLALTAGAGVVVSAGLVGFITFGRRTR